MGVIGRVESPFKTVLDAPRQEGLSSAESAIVLDARYAAGLDGVEPGMDLLVVWWAHEADRTMLARPNSRGVFAHRIPHRPNPIMVTTVRVVRVDGARLVVRGLDAVDGSPVLDLKSARADVEGWYGLPGTDL